MRYICDRIAVVHKGKIVELAETEELFAGCIHPYTRALLSAIPQPDPELERGKKLLIYDPSLHNYANDPPAWTEVAPEHFVYANAAEIKRWSGAELRK
jgi:ABC-type oligopeptide transport system ATPase subunit